MAPVVGMREQGSIEVGCVHQLQKIEHIFDREGFVTTLYLCLSPGSVPHPVSEISAFEVLLLRKYVKNSVVHPDVPDFAK